MKTKTGMAKAAIKFADGQIATMEIRADGFSDVVPVIYGGAHARLAWHPPTASAIELYASKGMADLGKTPGEKWAVAEAGIWKIRTDGEKP